MSTSIREQRLDDLVHYLDVRGTPPAHDLGRMIDAALADGVRWLIVDIERAALGPDAEPPLAAAGCELRERRGELILISPATEVATRVAAYEQAVRPALAASVDQALMILKMLRPTATIERPRKRITSITLPAIEPPATA